VATNLREIRFRLDEKELSRIEQLKKEFGFKSRSRLVRLLVTCSAEKLEDKIHVADEKLGKEIHDTVVQIANDLHSVKLNLQRMGNNVNQIARVANSTGQISQISAQPIASAGTDFYEIKVKGNGLSRNELYENAVRNRMKEYLKIYEDAYRNNDKFKMSTYAKYIEMDCENADELLAQVRQNCEAKTAPAAAAVQQVVQVQNVINFDADEVRNLIEELDAASEQLGQLLWQIK